jgi:hypothetical protein
MVDFLLLDPLYKFFYSYIYIIFIDDLTYEGLELLGLICYFAQKHPQNIRYTVVFYLLLVILLTLLLLFSIFIH